MMMKTWRKIKKLSKENGQSLVEIAIVLPIFILIIAGIVEVANLLNTQNKLTTASRIAAGYGAANYDADNFVDSTAPDMGLIALNTVTETLELDGDRWDIWSITAKTAEAIDGRTILYPYTYTHVFGNNQIVTMSEWEDVEWQDIEYKIISELRDEAGCDEDPESTEPCPFANDIEVVASVPYFRQNAILGLEISKWANLDRLRGLTVMRVDTRNSELTVYTDEESSVEGCPLLPIAVRVDQWALYPSDWLDDMEADEDDSESWPRYEPTAWNNHDVQPFPPSDCQVWEFPEKTKDGGPSCKADDPFIPIYDNAYADNSQDDMQIIANPDEWENNLPGYSLRTMIDDNDFREGYLFWAREEPTKTVGSGNFGWLTWNGDPDADKLRDSLEWPDGDFNAPYPDSYTDSRADEGELVNINDYDPDLPFAEGLSGDGDDWLEVGEWVEGAPGNKDVAGKQGLKIFVYNEDLLPGDTSTEVVLIVFDELNDDSGSNTNYQVAGFVLARVLGYSFGGNKGNQDPLYGGKWIVFELLGKATKCYNHPDPDGS